MTGSFPFYLHSGLLTKEHRKKMGAAIWEFLWCINKTTKEYSEDGQVFGQVLGGKPVKLSDIADDLGGNKSTIKRNLDKLEEEGYLSIVRAPYGLIITVNKSKKWPKKSVANSQRQPNKRKFTVAKMQRRVIRALRKCVFSLQKRNARCKNAHSNKDKANDKIKDLNNITATTADIESLQKCNAQPDDKVPSPMSSGEPEECIVPTSMALPEQKSNVIDFVSKTGKEGVPFPRKDAVPSSAETDAVSGQRRISASEYRRLVEERYIARRAAGSDLSPKDDAAIAELIKERVPLSIVLEGIDEAFKRHKQRQRHARDRINSLNYCLPIIFDLHDKHKAKSDERGELPVIHSEKKTWNKARLNAKRDNVPPMILEQLERQKKLELDEETQKSNAMSNDELERKRSRIQEMLKVMGETK
jgi:DNA-binding transcriptional regulator YhcF (GntR family)